MKRLFKSSIAIVLAILLTFSMMPAFAFGLTVNSGITSGAVMLDDADFNNAKALTLGKETKTTFKAEGGDTVVFSFTPSETDIYVFTLPSYEIANNDENAPNSLIIYDSNKKEIKEQYWWNKEELRIQLEKGKKYYFGVKYYSEEDGFITAKVEKQSHDIIKSVTLDIKMYEGDAEKNVESTWNDETESEEIIGTYNYYDWHSYDISDWFVIEDKEGNKYNGSDAFGRTYPDLEVSYGMFDDDQSYENEWGKGSHKVSFELCDMYFEGTVTIVENQIASVTVVKEPSSIVDSYNYMTTDYIEEEDSETEEYGVYDYWPDEITVILKNDKVYAGNFYDIVEEIHDNEGVLVTYDVDEINPQSYENQWTVGDYPCVLTFGGKEVKYNAHVTENPISSVVAEDVIVYEGSQRDNGRYYFSPINITVKTTDGKTYNGHPGDVGRQMSEDGYPTFDEYADSDVDQNDTEWTVGNTYNCTYRFGGKEARYKATVVETPIASLEVEDVTCYDGEQYSIYDFGPAFDIAPRKIVVRTKNNKTYEGEPYNVKEQLEKDGLSNVDWYYDSEVDQYDDSWTPGNSYDCTFTIAGKSAPYKTIILENPVASITAEDIEIYLGDVRIWIDEEGEEHEEYRVEPQNITVKMKNGKEYSGREYEIWEAMTADGYNSPQIGNYPEGWRSINGVGTYNYYVNLYGVQSQYKVKVIDNPVEKIIVEDKTISEGDIQEQGWRTDSNGNRVSKYGYYSYPEKITVVMKNGGKTYTGMPHEVENEMVKDGYLRMHLARYEEIDQYEKGDTTQWTVGSYTCKAVLAGKTATYKVNIVENPIESVQAEDITLFENDKPQYFGASTLSYDCQPKNVTVKANGKTYSGELYEVADELYDDGLPSEWRWGTESNGNWKVGKHKGTFTLGGRSTEYNINIIKNTITSVSVDKVTLHKSDGVEYDPTKEEFDYLSPAMKKTTVFSSAGPKKITVVAGGKNYYGEWDEVIENIKKDTGISYLYSHWYSENTPWDENLGYTEAKAKAIKEWDVGTHTATLYLGGKRVNYTVEILPDTMDIKDTVVTGVIDKNYTGKAVTQSPTVKMGQTTLKLNTDYTLSYKNNVKSGTATMTVTGKGSYAGTKEVTFKILPPGEDRIWERKFGFNAYDTMESIINEGIEEGKFRPGGTVIIATAGGFHDALAAAGLAGRNNAAVVLTKKTDLKDQTIRVLKALNPSKVYIAGGEGAITPAVENAINRTTGKKAVRLAGDDAADTSARMALAANNWSKDKTAIIATNGGFHDALAAAPVAYAKGYPILLASKKGTTLKDPVKNAIKTMGIKKIIIVGGTGAVSENVEKELIALGINKNNITRLSGDTAIETSAEIAEWGLTHGMTPNYMGVATSTDYYDALSGAALCGANNSVLILEKPSKNGVIPKRTNTNFAAKYKPYITKAYVFGGEAAITVDTWGVLINTTA